MVEQRQSSRDPELWKKFPELWKEYRIKYDAVKESRKFDPINSKKLEFLKKAFEEIFPFFQKQCKEVIPMDVLAYIIKGLELPEPEYTGFLVWVLFIREREMTSK